MNLRSASVGLALIATLVVGGCASTSDTTTGTTTSTTTSSSTMQGRQGPGSGVDASSVTTEAQLIALVQDAYGDASLDLHRGHQPVQDVLDTVLTISHDELHVRMDQGANLAQVATDLGIDPQTLIDALVASRSTAVDAMVEAGTLTEAQGEAYVEALTEAFTYRVTWDGSAETPTFTGIAA